MTKRLAIYTRVSKDNFGDERSPTRQEADCRAFAAIRDWEVVAAYRDVDRSAYRPHVRRPGYEALVAAIADRRIDGVLVWKLDRLVRRSAEFERFWARCEAAEVLLASVTEPIDTSNELGLAIVRILVTFAGLESSTKSLRLKAAARAKAFAGQRHSGARAYGFSADGSAVVPEEAAVIREAATRVLNGESLASVARDLRAREIRGGHGGVWSGRTLGRLLSNPSLAGLCAHRGEIVAKGSWPAILDELTSARLRLLLADPTRRGVSRSKSLHLLSGLLRCGRCERPLSAGLGGHPPVRVPCYRCRGKPDGCGRIYAQCDMVDDLVATAVLDRISQLQRQAIYRSGELDATTGALTQAIERRRLALAQAARDYYVRHVIDRRQFLAVRDELDRELDEEHRELSPLRLREMLARLDGQAPLVAWNGFDIPQRREMLAAVLDHVVVHPTFGGGRFRPERVEIFWLGQGSPRPNASRAVPPPKRRRPSPGETFTSKQAADYVNLNTKYLTKLIRGGELEAIRRKHGWEITQDAIDAFLEERSLRAARRASRPDLTGPGNGYWTAS